MLNLLNSLIYGVGCVTILFVVVGAILYALALGADYRAGRASLAQRNLQRKNPK